MAGIGFELRKLYLKEDKLQTKIKSYFYTSFITIGTTLITFITLKIMEEIINYYTPEENIAYFTTSVSYSFIFSQILFSPWSYFLSRYISDCIYEEKEWKIKNSLIGVLRVNIVISYIIGKLQVHNSLFVSFYEDGYILLLIVLSSLFIVTLYISILKNYKYIVGSYLIGGLVSCLALVILKKYEISPYGEFFPPYKNLICYFLGIIVIFYRLVTYILENIKGVIKEEYYFIREIYKYKELVLSGFFIMLGLWGHVLINWLYFTEENIGGVFKITGYYFTIFGYSNLAMIPLFIYFTNFMELDIYEYCQNYYRALNNNLNLDRVEELRKKLAKKIQETLKYAFSFQIIFILILLVNMELVLKKLNIPLSNYYMAIRILLGTFMSSFFCLFSVILLYFDQRNIVKKLSRNYMILIFIGAATLRIYFPDLLGTAFLIGSFISLIFADRELTKLLSNISYESLYSRNFIFKTPIIFRNIEKILYKRGDIFLIIITQIIFFK